MWKIAWRQLFRNRTRTLITGSAIALTYALFLFSVGLGDGMYGKMMEAAERSAGGGVLVHGAGYWESQASDAVVPDPAPVVAAAEALPGVRAVVPRVLVNGLLASPDGNAAVRLQGIDVAREAELRDMSRYLADEGGGTFLAGDDARAIVLGKALVDELEVELGDRVVLTATGVDGEMVRALFRLRGVIDSGSEAADKAAAYTTLAAAQEAVGMGGGVTQLGLLLRDDVTPAQVRDRLRVALGDAAAPLELLTWQEAMPELVGFIEMDSNMNVMTSVIIFMIVAFGIANTFLMSVMERVRELGLLSALGLTPARVGGLVLRETALLSLMSIALGLAIGYAITAYLSTHGIDYGELMGGGDMEVSGVVMDDMLIYARIVPAKWAASAAVVFGLVVLSAMYPAWRATRLNPTEAMRTYE